MICSRMAGLPLAVLSIILAGTGGCAQMAPLGAYYDQLTQEQRANRVLQEQFAKAKADAPGESVAAPPAGPSAASHGDTGVAADSAILVADTPSTTAPARMLVYNARLVVAVPETEPAMRNAEKLAGDLGGYVQKVEKHAITLRVPAARFREAVDKLAAYGAVLDKNIDAQDVTEDYMDLELRLTNARAMRKRLEELLARAKDVKETLEVEKELNRVREEIERLEGKITYLSRQVRFSTIVVQWMPIERTMTRGRSPALPFPWLHELGVETLMRLGKM